MIAELMAVAGLLGILAGLVLVWLAGLALGYFSMGRSSDYGLDTSSEMAEALFLTLCVVGPLLCSVSVWGAVVSGFWVFVGGTYLGIGWAERRFRTSNHTGMMKHIAILALVLCVGEGIYAWFVELDSPSKILGLPLAILVGSVQLWIAALSVCLAENVDKLVQKAQAREEARTLVGMKVLSVSIRPVKPQEGQKDDGGVEPRILGEADQEGRGE